MTQEEPRTPDQWRALIGDLQAGLLERELPASALLLAALAGEHVLLIGPPGTAKSLLARRLGTCLKDATYFERLLTRFSTPEELFGPLSLQALEQDRYERLVAGFLPQAGVAFLDEVFKAHSAILNTLLGVLNERVFDNGTQRLPVPLVSLVGASNEWPEDTGLAAFFDRFLLRVPVSPVSDANFLGLLNLRHEADRPTADGQALTLEERSALLTKAESVGIGEDAANGLQAFRSWLGKNQITLSDRRWRQWLRMMRVAAAAEGRTSLDVLDLWSAPWVAANTELMHKAIAHWFQHLCLGATAWPLIGLQRAVQAFETQLDLELSLPPAEGSGEADDAGKLALARAMSVEGAAGDTGISAAQPLRIRSERLETHARRHFSLLHVQARLAEVDALRALLQQRLQQASASLGELELLLKGRVWPPSSHSAPWVNALLSNVLRLKDFLARTLEVREGFAQLPIDAVSQQSPAPAVAWADDALA